MVELAERFEVPPTGSLKWKKLPMRRASEIVEKGKPSKEPNAKELHVKIGQLAMENDFLSAALGRIGDPSAKR